MRHLFRLLATALVGVVLTSCDGNDIPGPDASGVSVAVSTHNSNVRVGESVLLVVKESGSAVSNQSVTFKTDNVAVATVDVNGTVTGVAPGSATITATVDEKSGTISIEVTLVPIATIAVSSPVNPLPLDGLHPVTLIVVAKDSANRTLTGRTFTYTSSNEKIVRVLNGQVYAEDIGRPRTPGDAVITVRAEGKSGSTTLTVTGGVPPSIAVAGRRETYVGVTNQLAATLFDAAHQTLPASTFEWSTSDPNIATVSQTGVVTGVAAGTVKVFARSGNVIGSGDARTVVVKQIDGGSFHGCFLDDIRTVYCWGRSSHGETGRVASEFPATRPTSGGGSHGFAYMTTGSSHACAITSDLVSTADGWCWGSNSRGTKGDGTFSENRPGQQVIGGLKFAAISGGYDHNCALTTAGVVYCWGGFNYGPSPTEVKAEPPLVALAAGFNATCGLDAAGKAYCWGSNDFGQLGTGDRVSSMTPRAIASAARFTSISSFFARSCGVTTQSEILCWGNFDDLGPSATLPSKKSGSVLFKSVVVGKNHYCGLDLSGVAYCWGANDEGQLGNSSTVASLAEPVRVNLGVAGIPGFSVLGAGEAHACGITLAGTPYCWGRGESLGRPIGSNVLEPLVLPVPQP